MFPDLGEVTFCRRHPVCIPEVYSVVIIQSLGIAGPRIVSSLCLWDSVWCCWTIVFLFLVGCPWSGEFCFRGLWRLPGEWICSRGLWRLPGGVGPCLPTGRWSWVLALWWARPSLSMYSEVAAQQVFRKPVCWQEGCPHSISCLVWGFTTLETACSWWDQGLVASDSSHDIFQQKVYADEYSWYVCHQCLCP